MVRDKSGEAEVHDRCSGSCGPGKERMSSHCEHMKKVQGALSSDTTNVGNKRWEPPVVDEDWHAI